MVDLPFEKEASHSHGYKTVGWKYPATSVGWYRKTFTVDKADRDHILADGDDLAVCTVRLLDSKGRFVFDACPELRLSVDGPVRILGVGNGDPAWQAPERPSDPDSRTFTLSAFNGLAQVLLQSVGTPGPATLTVESVGLPSATLHLTSARN